MSNGKGLVVVGPDVMPSVFYDGQPPPPPARRSLIESLARGAAHAVGAAAWQLWSGMDARQPASGSSGGAAVAAADRGYYSRYSRSLLQLDVTPAFPDSSIPVNLVSGPMGIVFTGYVSDPGGNLAVSGDPPSQLANSELAAQQLLAYLRVGRGGAARQGGGGGSEGVPMGKGKVGGRGGT